MADIKVYDGYTDQLIPVTQEWCDNMSKSINDLANHRLLIKRVAALSIVADKEKLSKIQELLDKEI